MSLADQYHEALRAGASQPSDVTICCRIKRPIALGQRASHIRGGGDRSDVLNSALSINSKRSGRSAKRNNNNNHSTLRSSTQSLQQHHLSSARSIRSHQSVNSTGSRQGSARKLTNRSSSMMHIYSSNTGRSLSNLNNR